MVDITIILIRMVATIVKLSMFVLAIKFNFQSWKVKILATCSKEKALITRVLPLIHIEFTL
jgi:hypothetical protein